MARLDPIGQCIYCGCISPPLTKEHIIPEGLGGKEYLAAATCEVCRVITAEAENEIGASLEPLLRYVGIKGKKQRSKTIRLKGEDANGLQYSVDRPLDEAPILAIILVPKNPPSLMLNVEPDLTCPLNFIMFHNPNIKHIGPFRSPGTFRSTTPQRYVRMIAKIAHAQAVASIGLGTFEPFLCDIIRNNNMITWPRLIGGCPESPEKIPGDQAVSVQIYLQPNNILLGRVRLFECLGGPIWDVVIGRLLKPLSIPPISATK